VAIVTGGSNGIGKAAAISLAREGANVAILARTQAGLDSTAAEMSQSCRPAPAENSGAHGVSG